MSSSVVNVPTTQVVTETNYDILSELIFVPLNNDPTYSNSNIIIQQDPQLFISVSTPGMVGPPGEAVKGVAFSISIPTAKQIVAAPPSPYQFTIATANNVVFKSVGLAANTSTYVLYNNGTQVATITWAANASVATTSLSNSAFTVAINDLLTLHGPDVADTNLYAIGGRVAAD